MQFVETDGLRVPVKSWASKDDVAISSADGVSALSQVRNVANLPFVFKHVALMPDAHMGYGVPIGTVFATTDAVVPNAVGVDIGCGMQAARLELTADALRSKLDQIVEQVRATIPVGFAKHSIPWVLGEFEFSVFDQLDFFIYRANFERELVTASFQLGTLGGGNHFIEFQEDENGYVWIMIHSGSRHFGFWIANHFNGQAVELNRHNYSCSQPDLAFLPTDTDLCSDYLYLAEEARLYAEANRTVMMNVILQIVREQFDTVGTPVIYDVPHNFVDLEHHFGKDVYVHRKGAMRVRKGRIGLIPGSMGTNSYVVRGKGNPLSFYSASHGAGRIMGRRAAKRGLSLEDEQRRLTAIGSSYLLDADHLDEAPSAYKDIDQVMLNQMDLVDIVHILTPLATIKG